MEAILVHSENIEQLKTVKAVLKALKVPFEPQKELPSLKKSDIDEAYNDMRKGKYTIIKTADLWK